MAAAAAAEALLSPPSTSVSLSYSRSLKKLWSLSFAIWSRDAVTKCERKGTIWQLCLFIFLAYRLF